MNLEKDLKLEEIDPFPELLPTNIEVACAHMVGACNRQVAVVLTAIVKDKMNYPYSVRYRHNRLRTCRKLLRRFGPTPPRPMATTLDLTPPHN